MDSTKQIQSMKRIPLGRILGVDYGRRRIGIAISDPSQVLATTLKTIEVLSRSALIKEIKRILQENHVVGVVVGMPYNLNGTVSKRGEEVVSFIDSLAKECKLPTFSWDERWTTVSAHKTLRELGKSPSKSRNKVDQMAAAFMLQSFLDRIGHLRKSVASEIDNK